MLIDTRIRSALISAALLVAGALILSSLASPARAANSSSLDRSATSLDGAGDQSGELKWHAASAPGGDSVSRAVDFGKDGEGYFGCVASQQALAMTPDGGHTWQSQQIEGLDEVTSAKAPDRSHCWVTTYGFILATADGGKTWQRQFDAERYLIDLGEIEIVKTATGYRGWARTNDTWSGDDNMLVVSTDGESWNFAAGPPVERTSDVTFTDDRHGWGIGMSGSADGSGAAFYTEDGGTTWLESVYRDCRSGFPRLEAATALTSKEGIYGWAVGPRGKMAKTTDGGRSWNCPPSDLGELVMDPGATDFISTNEGWVVGTSGQIAHTTDGGTHWTRVASPTAADLTSLSFADATHGWAGGAGGDSLAPTFIAYTNSSPTCQDANAKAKSGVAVLIKLSCSDPDGDLLVLEVLAGPAHAKEFVFFPNQRALYTPREDFVGKDSFRFIARDGNGGADIGVARVTVEAPVATTSPATSNKPQAPSSKPATGKLKVISRHLTAKHGSVRLRVKCVGQSGLCKGRLRLVDKGSKVLTGSRGVRLVAGKTKTVKLRLSRRGVRALRRAGNRAKAGVQLRDGQAGSQRWRTIRRSLRIQRGR